MNEDLVVRAMRVEADGVLSVEVVYPDGAELPAWEPGAHIDLRMRPGLSRQYSLSGDPRDRYRYRLGILRETAGRGGSAYAHETLRPGQLVRFTGPRNHFKLEAAPSYLFIAGGIGITPILPMLAQVEAEGAAWTLLYGGRTAASMAFTSELATYGDQVTLWPQDSHGLLDLDAALGTPRPDTLVYCCGPEALLTAVEERCAAWPAGTLHLERFAATSMPPRWCWRTPAAAFRSARTPRSCRHSSTPESTSSTTARTGSAARVRRQSWRARSTTATTSSPTARRKPATA
jgi:ferredoxin-NADP reductase